MRTGMFEVTYGLNDGYAGGERPHHFDIRSGDIEPNMSDKELTELFWSEIQHDFEQNVSPYCDQEAEFLEWAHSVQSAQEHPTNG